MPASNRTISHSKIEKEIYKTFELFKEKKTVSIADYLKSFNASVFGGKEYRKIKFPFESLVKLVLFQKLKGIRFQTRVVRYLKRNPSEKFKLGFSTTPDQTTISYFLINILDDETKELLDFAVSKIHDVSEKFGILFDVKTLEPEKPIKETKERNQRLQKNDKTSEICKLFKKRVAPFINLNQNHNTVYKKNELIDLLIHLGLSQDFAENGSRIFKELRRRGPDADTLLYHLKKYENINELQNMFQTLFEVIWNMARQANLFDIRRRVDVAIDYTEWFYYGRRNTPMTVGKKPERGTDSCYKFATISIVEAGKRFTLLALPVSALDDKEKILTKLLSYAVQKIKINNVYLDRGFFDSLSIRTINKFHLNYLMPAIHSFSVKRVMDLTPAPAVVTGFVLNNVRINLIILEETIRETGQKIKRLFATNMDFDANDVGLLERLFLLYSKRWGIETSYRVKKHSFRGKTTSKNYKIRLFYFMFSVLLYNLWILADVLIWLHLFGNVGEKHLVTSKYFGTALMNIDPGG